MWEFGEAFLSGATVANWGMTWNLRGARHGRAWPLLLVLLVAACGGEEASQQPAPSDAPEGPQCGEVSCLNGDVCCSALHCAGMCVPDCRIEKICPEGLTCDAESGVCLMETLGSGGSKGGAGGAGGEGGAGGAGAMSGTLGGAPGSLGGLAGASDE